MFLAFLALSCMAGMAQETKDTVQMREITVVPSPKQHIPYREQAASVSTLSLPTIQQHQITSLKGLSYLTPNFFMPDYGSRLSGAVYIRGIGSRINTPAVGLYVDDVPCIDKSAYDFQFVDVEQVNVLRGPQSTLYGRNTMGGLVEVRTRNPMDYQGTDVQLGFATGDLHRTASVTHYHRPFRNLAFSGGGYYDGGEGFFHHSLTDKRVDYSNAAGGRMRLLWEATQRLSLDGQVKYDWSREGAYPYYYMGASIPSAEEYQEFIDKITPNHEGSYRRGLLNAALKARWKGNGWELNSVTGYQNLHDRMFMDQDFLPADIFTMEQKQRQHTLTEEITLKTTGQRCWQRVTGVSLQSQWLHTQAPITFMQEGVDWLSTTTNQAMPDLSSQGLGPMTVTYRNTSLCMGGAFDTPLLNAAVYHQSTLRLASRLNAVAGLRLDYDHLRMDYDASGSVDYDFLMTSSRMPVQLNGLNASPRFLGTQKNDYLQLMPKVSIRYDLGKQSNLYATISRGSRSGGYNVQMFSDLLQEDMRNQMMMGIKDGTATYLNALVQRGMPQAVVDRIIEQLDAMPIGSSPEVSLTTVYKPEYSWNYEAGTHLTWADGRWNVDAAVFYIDTRDQQIARFSENGFGRMMVNAGKSSSCGAELTLQGSIGRHLGVTANYGYTHATFRHYDAGDGINYDGYHVPFAPMHTCSADASYTLRFIDSWARTLTLGATFTGAGRIYWTEDNTSSQPFYGLLSARILLQTQLVQIELWGRNLTRTKYNTFAFQSMNRWFCQHGKPLQIGVTLRCHF